MKTRLFFCMLVCIAVNSNAQTKGPLNGQGFSNQAIPGSNKSWITAENAEFSDDNYSDFGNLSTSPGSYTDYIIANKFGFDVPPGAIINGIVVEVERSDANQNTADYSIRIIRYGVITGDEKSTGDLYPATDSYKTYGSSTDLWGEFWDPDIINDDGFGIAIAAQRINGTTDVTLGQIDNIRITVYYTDPSTLPVSLISFTAKKNNHSVALMWIVTEESDMSHYEVQRSADGRNFSTLQSLSSLNSATQSAYSANDNQPLNRITYYRLKMVENNGTFSYSKIVAVQSATGSLVTLYPSPWKKGTTLYISNPNNEKLTAYFMNSAGQQVGVSVTNNSSLPANILNRHTGLIFYRVFDEKGIQLATGNLLVK